jgi:hypothetical protein
MPLWLGRPREFEQLDQAINDLCCAERTDLLDTWSTRLAPVINGAGIVDGFLGLDDSSTKHFRKHWVGNYAKDKPPLYWPYAWGRDPHVHHERVLIDRLMAFGMKCSIEKVSAARKQRMEVGAACACPRHFTVWICLRALSAEQEALAYADKEYRKKLFRIGVAESRDAVVFVITTPHPGEHVLEAGVVPGFVEPVVITSGFTEDETPAWNPPATAVHGQTGETHGVHH